MECLLQVQAANALLGWRCGSLGVSVGGSSNADRRHIFSLPLPRGSSRSDPNGSGLLRCAVKDCFDALPYPTTAGTGFMADW